MDQGFRPSEWGLGPNVPHRRFQPLVIFAIACCASILWAQESAPATGPSDKVRRAVIEGQVIDDVTGAPLSEFEFWYPADADSTFRRHQWTHRFSLPVEANGKFELSVPLIWQGSNRFRLLAAAPGYAGGRSVEITTSGERVKSIVIRMVRGTTLAGGVVDRKGHPIEGARVTLEEPPLPRGMCVEYAFYNWESSRPPSGTTDSSGRFAIPHVLDGSYSIAVRHPSFAHFGPARDATLWIPESGVVAHPDIILAPGCTIRGRVKLENGQPDTRACVCVGPTDEERFDKLRHHWARTDSTGRFEIFGLGAGAYGARVTERDGRPDYSVLFSPGSKGQVLLSLSDGEVKDLDL